MSIELHFYQLAASARNSYTNNSQLNQTMIHGYIPQSQLYSIQVSDLGSIIDKIQLIQLVDLEFSFHLWSVHQ
jgi:hypothetical protein